MAGSIKKITKLVSARGLLTLIFLAGCAQQYPPFTSTNDMEAINDGGYAASSTGQIAVVTNDELGNNGVYPKFGDAIKHIQNLGIDCQDQVAAQVNIQTSRPSGVTELIGHCVQDNWQDIVDEDPTDFRGIHPEALPEGVQKDPTWTPPDLSGSDDINPPTPDLNVINH